ncbi:MAG TPA: superoxide dismutase [Firmicutes bacterium]|jgi:Fe-Mn family superoxide dismutase|nr:superoxide dismutase [Candidatus Fermentithermobacillaceae bacterium]
MSGNKKLESPAGSLPNGGPGQAPDSKAIPVAPLSLTHSRCPRVDIGQHDLPPLPYPYSALEPYIGRETVRIHHDIHHKGYVTGLNQAELELSRQRDGGDFALNRYWEEQLAFNGSGHILHSIYWTNMAPPSARKPSPGEAMLAWINISFGSLDGFKGQLTAAAEQVQGSGWAALVWNPAWQRLEVLQIRRHENLTEWGAIPLLVVDVWEHAYYLDYQNRRAEYLKAWWNLVDWNDVERRMALAMDSCVPLVR